MGWLRVRYAPAPPPGLTWTSATLTASWDMGWSDGVQRPPTPQYGVINALGTEFITQGGTQTDWFRVPGTDTGSNQILGPIVKFEFVGVDNAGKTHTGTWSQQVDATSANEWDIRRQAATALTGTNTAGVNPPGLSAPDIGVTVAPFPYGTATAATGGIVRLATNADSNVNTPTNPTHVLTAANQHAARHAAGGADAITTLGNLTIANPSGNTGIEFGKTSSVDAPQIDSHSSGNPNNYDVRLLFTGGTATDGQGTLNVQGLNFQWNGSNLHTVASIATLNNASDQPALLPTIAYAAGGGSAANLTQATAPQIVAMDAKELVVKLDYLWNLASTTQFTITAPTVGWGIVSVQFGAFKTGAEAIPQFELPPDSIRATFAGTTGRVIAVVRLKRP